MKKIVFIVLSVALFLGGCGKNITKEELDKKVENFVEDKGYQLYSDLELSNIDLSSVENVYSLSKDSVKFGKQFYIFTTEDEEVENMLVITYYHVEEKDDRIELEKGMLEKTSESGEENACQNGEFVIEIQSINMDLLEEGKTMMCK